ncbi:MAG TPA: class I SAM-dependent methyltransferase [Terracidiphilus sp.]|nr:class I SAM-dependent methyltransferase [Terracidiphilus sp.]
MKVKKAFWNKEFSGGKWNFIDDTANDCIYPHLEKYACGGDILDLGCGPGNTANELASHAYRSYIGIDISDSAIAKGITRTNETGRSNKNKFVCSDFLGYMPTQEFDVILFRESLYHVPHGRVLQLLAKYSEHLKPSGVFIVRLYLGDFQTGRVKYRVKRKLDLIRSHYNVVESSRYDIPGTPTVLIFQPRTAKFSLQLQDEKNESGQMDSRSVRV